MRTKLRLLRRRLRPSADLRLNAMLLASLAAVDVGFGLAWLPLGFIVGGLSAGALTLYQAADR